MSMLVEQSKATEGQLKSLFSILPCICLDYRQLYSPL